MKAGYIRLTAFAVYAISFFMPAARLADDASRNALLGWQCAWAATLFGMKDLAFFFRGGFYAKELLLPASGLLNLLFIAACVLCFWPRMTSVRLVLGVLMLPCLAATWVFFAISQTTPLAGCFAWAAACILIAIPDAVEARRRWRKTESEAAGGAGGDPVNP
jgi:hypothetical protein